MINKSRLVTGVCIATMALCGTITAAEKKAAASKPAAADATATTETAPAKPPRPISYHGNATAIDQTAKSFTLAGKKNSRVIMVTDKSEVTKAGQPATLAELTENGYVTGSYWKQADGTLEAKSVKIGGKSDAEKAKAGAKKKKTKKAATEEEEPAATSTKDE